MEVTKEKSIKVTVKVLVPTREHPKVGYSRNGAHASKGYRACISCRALVMGQSAAHHQHVRSCWPSSLAYRRDKGYRRGVNSCVFTR